MLFVRMEKNEKIIGSQNNGASFAKIAREKGMNESSILTIYDKREKTAKISIE
jgi:hypothetical protein